MKKQRIVGCLVLAAVAALGTGLVSAQALPKGSDGKVKVKKMEKLLTKEQLRDCMKMADDITVQAAANEKINAAMKLEKAELEAGGTAAPELKKQIEDAVAGVKAVDAKLAPYGQVRADLDARAEAYKSFGKGGRNAEREAKALEEGYKKLKADTDALLAERQALVDKYDALAKQFDGGMANRNTRAEDWNKRNVALVNAQNDVLELQAMWNTNCKNRPYREEDEIAIKAELKK